MKQFEYFSQFMTPDEMGDYITQINTMGMLRWQLVNVFHNANHLHKCLHLFMRELPEDKIVFTNNIPTELNAILESNELDLGSDSTEVKNNIIDKIVASQPTAESNTAIISEPSVKVSKRKRK